MILFEPSAAARLMVAARLAEGVPDRAAHLVPIWRAVAEHGVAFATVLQNEGRFTVPDTRPARRLALFVRLDERRDRR